MKNDCTEGTAHRLIRAAEFRTLLGGVSDMFLYRRANDDPDFPSPFLIGGNRFWRLKDALAYIETKCAAA